MKFAILTLLAALTAACAASGPSAPAGGGAELPPVPPPPAPAASLEERVDAAATQAAGEAAEIRVTNAGGTVLLTGQVLSEEARASVSNAVAFSSGQELRRMVNELRVVDAIDRSSEAADERLRASVERLLDRAGGELGATVQAVVDQGMVYLLGSVSREEGAEAAGLVSRLEGVASVRTVFDYTD